MLLIKSVIVLTLLINLGELKAEMFTSMGEMVVF